MAARITLKTVNDELARLGHSAKLAKSGQYFYFSEGETVDWLDRTVKVSTLSSLTLEQWIAEYDRLKKVNAEIMGQEQPAKRSHE